MDTTTIKGQILYSILGNVGIVMFIACLFWAVIGTIISFLMNLAFRDPTKEGTPIEFSWKVFWKQNAVRILLNALVLITAIVFYTNLYHKTLTTFWALVLGLSLDQVIIAFDKLRKKTRKINLDS